jgi:hypothetical protein
MKNTHKITAANIDSESFYNLTRLQKLTGYANPIGAIKAIKAEWTVEKDKCGNITGLVK